MVSLLEIFFLREEFPRVWVQHRRPVAGARRKSRPLVPAICTHSDLDSIMSEGISNLPLSPPQKAPVVEHVLCEGIQRPIVALAGVPGLPRYFDEAVVEREVVSDAVLPRGELLAVVGEAVADEVADPAESQPLVRRLQYGHRDEGDVRVWRLHDAAILALAVAVLLVGGLVAIYDSVLLAVPRKHVLPGGIQLAVGGVASRVDLGLWRGLVKVR